MMQLSAVRRFGAATDSLAPSKLQYVASLCLMNQLLHWSKCTVNNECFSRHSIKNE